MEEKGSNGKAAKRRNNGKQINCRYGAECRNIGKCKFVHPSTSGETTAVDNTAPSVTAAAATNKAKKSDKASSKKQDKSKIPCRYGMDCLHPKCPYFHHPSAAAAAVLASSSPDDNKCTVVPPPTNNNGETSSSPSSPLPTPTRKATNKKKCRWGAGCRNKKCAFTHPAQHPRNSQSGSNNNGESTKSPVMKSPSSAAAAANSLGDLYSVNTPPTGFQPAGKTTPSPTKSNNGILFPTLSSLESPDEEKDKVPTPPTTSSLSNPPGFGGYSPLFAKGSSAPPSNNSTPLSSSNGVKSNIYSYLSSNASTPTSMMSDVVVNNQQQLLQQQLLQQQQRTPLYCKEVSPAFNTPSSSVNNDNNNKSMMNGGMGGGTFSGGGRMRRDDDDGQQNLPIDADWLHEVLGLDGLDVSENNHHGVTNGVGTENNTMWEKSLETLPPQHHHHQQQQPPPTQIPPDVMASVATRIDNNNVEPEPIDPYDSDEKSSGGVILISEDEISQSRRAALELRLESQQTVHRNADFFFSLLEQCRTNQKKVQSALEESMDPTNDDPSNLDEANVMALLELNELLIGAISVAESSEVHNSFAGSDTNGKVAKAKPPPSKPKSEQPPPPQLPKVSEKPPPAKDVTVANKSKEKPAKTKKAKKTSTTTSETASKKGTASSEKKATFAPVVDKVITIVEPPPEPKIDPAEAAKQEKERIARLMQEARQQAAAAKEKKKNKKSKKFDKWVKEQEQAKESRAKSWEKKISRENDYIGLIQKLILAEFLRQSKEKAMGLTADRVMSDAHASEIVEYECREAYHTIFRELKVRITVAGSENKDLNGRNGTIRYWDKDKKKFCVGLDTKKATDNDVQFLEPELLDVATSSSRSNSKSDKSKPATEYTILKEDIMTYGGVSLGLDFTINKTYINALGSAENTNIGLEAFCLQRDEEDRQKKLEEEREKAREEEDRKRRAAKKAQENAAWEKRKEQMKRDKEEYERMKREWRMNNDDDDDDECRCPRCRFGNRFGARFTERGGTFFFNIGGLPFRVRFDDFESDDEESFFDDFDDRWEEKLQEEKREENRKMAKVLGVEPNADERTIKVAYRKLALQFHPDKWRNDSGHGMSRKDAENKFKSIQGAYDHLMSNFDESDEEEY